MNKKEYLREYQKQYRIDNKDRKREYRRQYRKDNKEKVSEYQNRYQKRYYRKNKDKARDYYLMYHFGISLEDYNDMFAKQEGKCAICGTHQANVKRALAVDHDHDTEKVRELLCGTCNTGLGLFNEDIPILISAIEYLKRHK